MNGRTNEYLPLSIILVIAIGAGAGASLVSLQDVVVVALFGTCLIPAAIALRRGSFDVFEPLVFYSLFMFMTTVVIFDRLYLQDPYLLYPEWVPWEFSTALLIVSSIYLFFFIFVVLGYYVDLEKVVTVPELFPESGEHDPVVLRYAGIFYVGAGFVFYLAFVGSALDWEFVRLYTTTEPRNELFSGAQHWRLGSRMLYLGYVLWLVSVILEGRHLRLLHVFFVFPLVLMFLLLGGRSQALLTLLAVVIVLYYSNALYPEGVFRIQFADDRLHRYVFSTILPALGLLSGLVVVVAGWLRSRRTDGASPVEILIDLLTFGIQDNEPDSILVTLHVVPEQLGYYYGTFSLRVVWTYIPRAIWETEPLTLGVEIRRIIRPEQSGGRPPGMIGDFYVDGGVVGIVLGAILFGLLLRYMYLLLRKNGRSPVFLMVYAFVLGSLVSGGLTNNALWTISNHLLLLSPVLVLDWASRNVDSVAALTEMIKRS